MTRRAKSYELPVRPALRDNGPVSITTAQEQQFYDSAYAVHLHVPDDALRTNRESMLRDLNQPSGAYYERRKLYSAVLGGIAFSAARRPRGAGLRLRRRASGAS